MRLRRRSTILAAVLGGTLSVTWPRRAALISSGIRSLSRRKLNAATRRGIRVDLGPARGQWAATSLAVDLSAGLSSSAGELVEGVAYSRFGGFRRGRPYSAFLDPESAYYQAWLGAFVVFDLPRRRAFGFDAAGRPQPDALARILDVVQRLVYESAGCARRFDSGEAIRPLGELKLEAPQAAGSDVWRVTGQFDTWSTYCQGGAPGTPRRGRFLYGKVPRKSTRPVEDFHPLTYSAEIWLQHDLALGATCAKFLVVPTFVDAGGQTRMPGQHLLLTAQVQFRQIRFLVDLP